MTALYNHESVGCTEWRSGIESRIRTILGSEPRRNEKVEWSTVPLRREQLFSSHDPLL